MYSFDSRHLVAVLAVHVSYFITVHGGAMRELGRFSQCPRHIHSIARSEERRVGKECVSTCRSLVNGVQTCALPICWCYRSYISLHVAQAAVFGGRIRTEAVLNRSRSNVQ